ncbi:MAG TPA: hypothetical protein DDZ88_07825 [Verrucomicrobiales bacterium]|nr:hypothetical protein [Verrucomicrobiales bacterium]
MTAAPFFFRVIHQSRVEWRHQRFMVLLWLLVLVLRQWHRVLEAKSTFSLFAYVNLELWLEVAPLLTGAAVVWRCVSADSPSNTDTFSLTRPVGQAALWCGKLLFVFTAVMLPLLLVMSHGWRGFGLGAAQWAAMSGAVLLAGGLLCALAGGITALASTSRQVIALAVLALVGAGVWLAMQERWAEPESITPETQRVRLCGGLVAGVLAFAGLMAAWWCATVPRRRFRAACLLLATLLISTWIAQIWRTEWLTRPEQKYANTSKLALKFGKAGPTDKTPGRGLWPTLRLTGLGKDEVVSIVEFAPVRENESWPPEGSHTDLPSDERSHSSWLHHDHTRALFKHSPATTLWRDHIRNDAVYNGRNPLNEVLQRLRMKREDAIQRHWRLRLVVHEMQRLATMPYRQMWTQENTFLVRPGMRLELNSFAWLRDAWEMYGRVHRVSSAVLPVDAFRNTSGRKRTVDDDFFLVLEDKELRENTAHSLGLVSRKPRYVIWQDHSSLWLHDENQRFEVRLWHPREQQVILQRSLDEWIDQQDASLWHAEERGTLEFNLTPEQMALVLPEPPPKEAKKP